MSPDILIYIQKVKMYLTTDDAARKYFLSDVDEESFYTLLIEISQKNFDKFGDPTLTKDQFEYLRNTLKSTNIQETHNKKSIENIYMNIGKFGFICLN